MKSKPGYKMTPLGWIPEDWELHRLSSMGNFSKGKGITKEELSDSGFPCIRYGEIYTTHDYFIKEFKSFISKDIAIISKRIYRGDILFAGSGETREDIGKAVAFLGNEKAYAGGDVIIYSPNQDQVFSEALSFVLDSSIVKRQKYRLGEGNQVVHIYPSDLQTIIIPLPSLPEQKAIAKALSTWDKAIEKTQELIKQKELRKKYLMQQLLTGKKRLKGFCGEWKRVCFEELADKKVKWSITGGPFGSNLKTEDYTEDGIRIIQLQNIGDGEFLDDYKIYTSKEKADELLSCNIYPGDIILSKMGDPVARACFIPATAERWLMASDGIRLCIDNSKYNNKFIHDYINNDIFRKAAISASTGSTRQRIGLNDLKALTLYIPDIEEQNTIAKICHLTDEEINLYKQIVENFKQQKKGLMQVLLTGKKRLNYDLYD